MPCPRHAAKRGQATPASEEWWFIGGASTSASPAVLLAPSVKRKPKTGGMAHGASQDLQAGFRPEGPVRIQPRASLREQAPPWVHRANGVFALKGRENRKTRRVASRALSGRWQYAGIKPRAALALASLPWAGFLPALQAEGQPAIKRCAQGPAQGALPLALTRHPANLCPAWPGVLVKADRSRYQHTASP